MAKYNFMDVGLPRIKYLFEQYKDDACTPSERKELMAIMQHPINGLRIKQLLEAEINKGLSDELMAHQMLSPEKAALIFDTIIDGNKKKLSIGMMYLWRIAAAAILIGVISFAGYFSMQKSVIKPVAVIVKQLKQPLAADALPGSKGAVLTLSNGQQIVLDSAGNGQLASQGGTTIVNKNGEIVYAVKGTDAGEVLYNTMSTAKGRQYQLILSDGTKVWLNSASSIRYPAAFVGNLRSVSITGEAYFEVAKDKAKPFVVTVNNMEVKVLGTHFNINAYADEAAIKTTLLEGSVQVSNAADVAMLVPGQQSRLYKTGAIQTISNADIEEAVAWKNGVFMFNNADIQSVMRQIGRWFDLEIAYEGALPKDSFGGKLPMDAKVSEVLGALEQTQVHFRIEGKRLIVMP